MVAVVAEPAASVTDTVRAWSLVSPTGRASTSRETDPSARTSSHAGPASTVQRYGGTPSVASSRAWYSVVRSGMPLSCSVTILKPASPGGAVVGGGGGGGVAGRVPGGSPAAPWGGGRKAGRGQGGH